MLEAEKQVPATSAEPVLIYTLPFIEFWIALLSALAIFNFQTTLMHKLFLLASLCCITYHGFSQKGIQGVIQAERSFAANTVANGIKTGFLQATDSTGKIFNNGVARNCVKVYSAQPDGPALLNWGPEHAAVSSSGDFGFTTGPYHLKPNRNSDSIRGRGQYNTIWHITPQGEWKFLADMGIRYNDIREIPDQVSQVDLATIQKETFTQQAVTAADQQLNVLIAQKSGKAFTGFISDLSWFNYNGKSPAHGKTAVENQMAQLPAGMVFEYMDGGIAASKDMAYTYGTITHENRKDNYMRVWCRQNGQWVILLQVISW
jgi:hypothetical protein